MPNRPPAALLQRLGLQALWLVIGLLFLGIGLQKLTAYEAHAIRPFAGRSPFLAWAYQLFGVRGASWFFAAVEIPTGLGLLVGLVRPGAWPARLGAAGAVVTAFVTSSFLLTTPGALVARRGLPLLSLDVGQFFAKDLVLLASGLVILGESLRARR